MFEKAHLREATAKDSSLLARLHAETFPENPWSADWFRNALIPPPVQAFLMEVAAEPAGFAVISTPAGEAEIITIGIRPEFQRRNLGTKLLGHIEAAARRSEARKLFLEVASGNLAALTLYRSNGFHEAGRRLRYYANGQDALVLAKDL